MKARRFFAFVAATAMLFAVGCTPDGGVEANGEKATISVTPTSFALDLAGGEQTITVTSNADWTVSCLAASDVTFEPAAGSGDGSVVVTVPASASDREFVITFSAEKPQIVEGMEFISKDSAEVSVSQNAGGQNMTEFLYYEKVGEGNVDKINGEWPYTDEWTGWLPEGPAAANVTYSGKKASVRASGGNYRPTEDAVGLTGQPYVFLNKLPVEAYFVIENLAVTGGANYTFKFNVSCQTAFNQTPIFAVVDNSLVHLEFGYDGKEWDAVDCEFVENGGNGWYAATAQFKVAADATTLYARLQYEAPASGGGGRFDDFKLVEGGNGDELAPEAPVVAEVTIADIKAAGNYSVKNAWVVATYANGCLLTDASGAYILAFKPSETPAVGEVLNIEGAVSAYGGLLQFGEGSVVTKTGETKTVTHPTPEVLDGAKLDALASAIEVKYVEYEGTLNISSGKYFNIAVAGASNQGSIQYPDEALTATLNSLNGKAIKVTGYSIGYTSSKYLNTMATSVVEGTATEPEQPVDPVVKTLPYEESFNTSKGDFTFNNVLLPEGSTYVWQWTSYNNEGYMQGSGYFNKTNCPAESWLVSPEISLNGATAPELTFTHLVNYANNTAHAEALTLWVKEATAADWAQLTIPAHGTGSNWTWVESGAIDLSAYVGKSVNIAFKYTSNTTTATTWRIKNFKVAEKGATTEPEDPVIPDTPVDPVDGLQITSTQIATVVAAGTYKLADGTTEQVVADESTWFTLDANGLSLTGCRVLINNNKDPYKGHAQFQGDASNVAKQGFLGNTLAYNDKEIEKIVVETFSTYDTPSFNIYYGAEKLPNTNAIATTANNCVKGASAGMDGDYEAFAFTCTFDIPAGNKFFALRNDSKGATYVKSITIVFKE